MRTLLALGLFLLPLLAHAGPQEMCSAELTYLDGTEQTAVLECDSPYAGQCLEEVVLPDGTHDWKEVACR
jgi:hypothetical protein